MKRLSIMKYKIACTLLLGILVTSVAFSQVKFSKAYVWKGDVNSNVEVFLKNYFTELKVETTSAGKLTFKYILIAEAEKQSEIDKLNAYLEKLSFEINKNKADLSTQFWKNQTSDLRLGKQKVVMNLNNGETVKLKSFSLKVELQIPYQSQFHLNSKYADIALSDLKNLELESFDDNIWAGNVEVALSANAKYSDLRFKKVANASLNLFDCDFTADKASNLSIESKYSDITFTECNNLSLTSFDDDITFEQVNNLSFNAKYTDYTCIKVNNLSTTIFDSDLTVDQINNLSIGSSKYCDIDLGSLNNLSTGSSFDDNYEIGTVTNVSINEMKYTDLSIENLLKNFTLKGFENSVDLKNISAKCQKIDIEQKYGEIWLNIPDDFYFTLNAKLSQSELDSDLVKADDEPGADRVIIEKTIGSGVKAAEINLDLYDVDISIK